MNYYTMYFTIIMCRNILESAAFTLHGKEFHRFEFRAELEMQSAAFHSSRIWWGLSVSSDIDRVSNCFGKGNHDFMRESSR